MNANHCLVLASVLLGSLIACSIADAGVLFSVPWGSGPDQIGYYNASSPGFDQPYSEGPGGIAIGPGDEIWISDQWNDRLLCFSRQGKLLQALDHLGGQKLSHPKALFVDRGRELYVVNGGDTSILRYDLSASKVQKLGSYGSGPGKLEQPETLLGVSSDTVCAEDYLPSKLVCFNQSGAETLRAPWPLGGLATDGKGSLYTVEYREGVGSVLVSTDSAGKKSDHFVLKPPSAGGTALQSPQLIGFDAKGNAVVRYVKPGKPSLLEIVRFDSSGEDAQVLGEAANTVSKQTFVVTPAGSVLGLSFTAKDAPSGQVEVVEYH